MKILYLFIISIIVLGSLYPAFALDTSKTCDANTLPHYGPHNPSHIYIKDTSGNLPYIPLTDHTAIFHDDDVWNTYPESRIVHVTLTIQNQDTGQLVFNQTQSMQMQACSGPESVKWRFVPIQVANYIATVSDNRDKEGMIFNSILDATKSQTVSSPLEQLRFGMDSHSVVCKQDLHLVIKSEDGSPACVTSASAIKLIALGWAVESFSHSNSVRPFDTLKMNVIGTDLSFNYTILGGQLENATANLQNKSLDLSLKTTGIGTLIVILPRGLIDSQMHGQDSPFIIMEDEREVKYKQADSTIADRMLIIPFQYGVTKIEIIAPEPIR